MAPFPLGRVVATSGALKLLNEAGEDPLPYLALPPREAGYRLGLPTELGKYRQVIGGCRYCLGRRYHLALAQGVFQRRGSEHVVKAHLRINRRQGEPVFLRMQLAEAIYVARIQQRPERPARDVAQLEPRLRLDPQRRLPQRSPIPRCDGVEVAG
jgi:hypothetical protein